MNRFLFPGPIYQTFGLTLIRLILGGFLIYHGSEIFSESKVNEYLSWDVFKTTNGKLLVYSGKLGELISGILFALGLLTRFAALLAIGTMSYITFTIGHGIIWYDDQHPFLFILLSLVFFFTGAGRFSLDNVLFKKQTDHAGYNAG